MKKIILFLSAAILLLGNPTAQAAFIPHPVEVAAGTPVKAASEALAPASSETVTHSKLLFKEKRLSFFGKLKHFFDQTVGKDQGIAALLAFFLGGISAHRFYLGHVGSGMIQFTILLLGLALISAGGPFTIFTGAAANISGATVVGIIVLAGHGIWVLVDFIRILAGTLKPKGGNYKKNS